MVELKHKDRLFPLLYRVNFAEFHLCSFSRKT